MKKNLLLFFAFTLSFSQQLIAEGSRDLYPQGASGYRAYLMSTTSSANWNPFATPGTMRVWVRPGETIYAGSSVHGFTRHNSNDRVGEIVLRSPDGTEYRSLSGSQNPSGGGLIKNRSEEKKGPKTGSQPDGYDPFTRIAGPTQGGVWEISFISLGTNTNIPSPSIGTHPSGTWNNVTYVGNQYDGNYAADADWVQPLAYGNDANRHVALIAAWDVSVGRAGNPAELIPGRLFTTVFGGTLPNGRFTQRAFYGKFYVLTPGGYAFLVDNNGQNGASFNFFSNDKGIHVEGQPEVPSYQSLNSSVQAVLAGRTRDPRLPDATAMGMSNVTNKLFFNKPANDLPASAPIHYSFNNTATTTWLKNPSVIPPAITGLNLACGGTVTFNSNVSGGYKVMIDIDSNGDFNDEIDRVLTGEVTAGVPVAISWDGRDGSGAKVKENVTIRIQVVVTAGEIHFPFSDVESNWDGIVIGQLTADGNYQPTGNYAVYWDDSNLGSLSAANEASTPTRPLFNNADGVDSRVNGHKWGGAPRQESEGSYFGNNRTMDTWSYVTGVSDVKDIVTCGLSLSGYVFNDVDGLDDGRVDNNNGLDPYPLAENILFATLLNGRSVVATMPIGTQGEYQFGNLMANTTYTVVISTAANGVTPGLPTPWINTGEFVGTTVGDDGVADGSLEVKIKEVSVSNANFGIQYKINIEGNVWHDINGDAIHDAGEKPVSGGNDPDGGASSITGGSVYANLVYVNSDNIVAARVQVKSDGRYKFSDVAGGTVYRIVLSEEGIAARSVQAPTVGSLPVGWGATGTNTEVDHIPTPNVLNRSNTIDLGMVTADVTGVNFAIQQPPVTDDSEYTLDYHPGTGTTLPLDGTVDAHGDKGEYKAETPIESDSDGKVVDFVVTDPVKAILGDPAGGVPVLYYEGKEVNQANFPGLRIPGYDPNALSVRLNGTGYKGISFDFKVIDNAGVTSNTSTYSIIFPRELPVKWKSINVREENGNAVLSWATAEEVNVSHFEVLYSRDALAWQSLKTVKAANGEGSEYRYTHRLTDSGMFYFKVKNVDFDGSTSLSSVVSLKGRREAGGTVYPNPVTKGVLTLDLESGEESIVKIYNLAGREVLNTRLKGSTLNVSSLSAGQYVLRVTTPDGGTFTRNFLVE